MSIRELSVPFESCRHAEVVCNTMSVDPEPKRSEVTKALRVEGTTLKVYDSFFVCVYCNFPPPYLP